MRSNTRKHLLTLPAKLSKRVEKFHKKFKSEQIEAYGADAGINDTLRALIARGLMAVEIDEAAEIEAARSADDE
jgi:hypothetical protein